MFIKCTSLPKTPQSKSKVYGYRPICNTDVAADSIWISYKAEVTINHTDKNENLTSVFSVTANTRFQHYSLSGSRRRNTQIISVWRSSLRSYRIMNTCNNVTLKGQAVPMLSDCSRSYGDGEMEQSEFRTIDWRTAQCGEWLIGIIIPKKRKEQRKFLLIKFFNF
jgi:hypothetical protein